MRCSLAEKGNTMVIDIIAIGIWSIAGVLTLCKKEVTKLEYMLCWIVLMMHLIGCSING